MGMLRICGLARFAPLVSIAGMMAYAPPLAAVVLAQVATSASPNVSQQASIIDQQYITKREQAQTEYYRAKVNEINDKWSLSLDRAITSGGLLLGLFTIVFGFLQWRSSAKANRDNEEREWETLRDGQFLDQLTRLSDKDNPRARESAAIMVAFLSMVTTNVPIELANALLEHAKGKEDDKEVSNAINLAIQVLENRRVNPEDDKVLESLYCLDTVIPPHD